MLRKNTTASGIRLAMGLTALVGGIATAHAAERASATIMSNEGSSVGTAELVAGPNGTLITLDIDGLSSGQHAIHIHQKGICMEQGKPAFKQSGGHINPDNKEHGLLNPDGPDAGDLPNFYVNDDGKAWAQMFTTLATLDGKVGARILDDDGAALVIHANPDDFKTQPIGGAGDRIACGVIEAE